jgi:hypothetical protein
LATACDHYALGAFNLFELGEMSPVCVAVSIITDEGFGLPTLRGQGPAETIQKVDQAYALNVIIL